MYLYFLYKLVRQERLELWMIIYFDWNNQGWSGDQDGVADHVGIVEKVVDNTIYTIEGNSGDQCAERTYSLGYYEVLGFGVPQY